MDKNMALRNSNAAQTLMKALADSYMDCAMSGRLAAWATCAQSIVTLLATETPSDAARDASNKEG